MTLFAWAGLSLGIACLLLAAFVLISARRPVHRIWAAFNAVVAFWGLGTFLAGISKTSSDAIFYWKLAYVPCTFIAIVFYHLVCSFCHLKRKKWLVAAYIQGIFFLPLIVFSNYFVNSTLYLFNSIFYHKATALFNAWVTVFVFIATTSFIELLIFLKTAKGIQKIQALYLFWGMALGWAGGLTTLIPPYNLPVVYPAWHFTICIYTVMMTYAIFRYQLMDIKIAVTRMGIFVLVYTLVLGIPFGLMGFEKERLFHAFGEAWLWVPMLSLLILATVGPFIFLYFQRKAEDAILQEEKKIQNLLKRASTGMTTMRDIHQVLKVILDLLMKNLALNHTAIYLLESSNNTYVLKVSEPLNKNEAGASIEENSPLIKELKKRKYPVVYEELRLLSESHKEEHLKGVVSQMGKLSAGIIVPAIVENFLLGFIILGERKEKNMYSSALIDILAVLGNQAALAIENAIFYEETGKDLAQKFHESRLKSLGALGTGIAHQMHNRFHVITFGGESLLQVIKSIDMENLSPKLEKLIKMVIQNVEKMVGSSVRGAEITEAIKNYAKKADAVPSAVSFQSVVKNSMELLYVKHHNFRFKFVEEYPSDVLLWVNFSNLQEVIFNAVDNSCDAMVVKKRLCESGEIDIKDYEPCVMIRGHVANKNFIFEIEDNGVGFEEDRLKKGVDVPFFTTKGASKGTGMGIHMMFYYIKQSKGHLRIESKNGEYTKMIFALPLAPGES